MAPGLNKDSKTAGKSGKAPNPTQDQTVLPRPAPAANTSSRPVTPLSQAAGQKAPSGSNRVPGVAAVGGGRQALSSNPQAAGKSPPSAQRPVSGTSTGDSARQRPLSSSHATSSDPAIRSRRAPGGSTGASRTPSPPCNPQATGNVTSRRVSSGSATGSEKASPGHPIVWACDGTGQSGTSESGEARSHRSNVYRLWQMFNKVLPANNGKHKALYHNGPAAGMQGNLKDKAQALIPGATGKGKSISL